ncbi:MAG: putative copper-importing P-type ATPase, partial [Bacteroidota bacterium]
IQNLLKNKGLEDVQVSFAIGEVSFTDREGYSLPNIKKDIESLGYQIIEPETPVVKGLSSTEKRFLFSFIFTLPLVAHMVIPWHPLHLPWVQFSLSLPVMIVGLYYFGKSAFHSLKSGVPNMDVLITIGASSAFIYSIWGSIVGTSSGNPEEYLFFETAASIITLVLLGNVIEQRSVKQTGNALRELAALQPETARRISDHDGHTHIEDIPAKLIIPGDLLLVNYGDKVPADGIIVEGSGLVNEALISGESLPVEKVIGSEVTGGTINEKGIFRMKAIRTGKESVLAGIIDLVKKAQLGKPPVQRLGDKISAVFVPVVIAIALITWLVSFVALNAGMQDSLLRAIAVLVISCPCAMGLATPTAVMAGIGRAAKLGILFRDGAAIEHLAKVDTMVLDKTGTLTTGNFTIEKLDVFEGADEAHVRSVIRSMEANSSHPIARSLTKNLSEKNIALQGIEESRGLGMKAKTANGNVYELGSHRLIADTELKQRYDLFLLENGKCIAALRLADELKTDCKKTIAELKAMGIKVVLLSGDSDRKCLQVANELGIDEVYSQQTPEDKLNIIRQLNEKGKTAMLGDGVNDAPALNLASVGISLGEASKVAVGSAQVVLLQRSTLDGLPTAVKLSRMSLRTIHQNLFWAFFYNTVAIPVAAAGFLQPMIAAFSMAFSDVVVIGNSILLQYRRLK